MVAITANLEARFWAKVNKDGPVPSHRPELGPCWVWTASTYQAGYGQIGMGSRAQGTKGAHVVSWVIANGPVPDGLEVLHCCDNRPCVRPEHLFVDTQLANMQDMHAKKRHPGPRLKGSANPWARLTEAQIMDIRKRFAAGERGRALATEFGVIPNTISRIVTGQAWPHAGGPLSGGMPNRRQVTRR